MPRRDPRSQQQPTGAATAAAAAAGSSGADSPAPLSPSTQRALMDDRDSDSKRRDAGAIGSLAHRRQLQQTTRSMEEAFRLLNPHSPRPTTLAKAQVIAPAANGASSNSHHASSAATLALVALASSHSSASSAASAAAGRSPPHLRAEPLSWSELQGRNLDPASTRRAAVSVLGVACDHAEARRRAPPTVDFEAQEPGHASTTTASDRRTAARAHEEARRRVLASGVDFEAQEPGHAASSHSSSMRESVMLQHLQQMHTPRRRHDSTPLAAASAFFSSPSVPVLSPSSVLLGTDLRTPSSASAASPLSHRSPRRSHSHGEQSSVAPPSGSRSGRRSGSGVLLNPMRNPSFHTPATERSSRGGRSRITEEEKGDEDDPASSDAADATVATAAPAAPVSVNQRVLDYFTTGPGASLWHSFATQMTREDAARLLAAVSVSPAGATAGAAPASSGTAATTAGGPRSPRSPVSPLSSSLKRTASLSVSPRPVVSGALIPTLDPTSSLESLHACCASLLAQVPPRRFTGAASLAPLLREMQKERLAILAILNSGRLLSSSGSTAATLQPKPWILRDVHRLIASTALVGSQSQCIPEPRLLRLLQDWSAATYKYDSLEEVAQVILMVHREVPKAAVVDATAAAKSEVTASGTTRGMQSQKAKGPAQIRQQSSTALSPRKVNAATEEKFASSPSQAAGPAPLHSAAVALHSLSPAAALLTPAEAVHAGHPFPQSVELKSSEVASPTVVYPPLASDTAVLQSDPFSANAGAAEPRGVNVLVSPTSQHSESMVRTPSRVVLEQASSAIHAIRAASPRGEARSISPFSAARFDALPQRLYEGVDGVWRDARGQEEASYRATMQTQQQAIVAARAPSNPNRQTLTARRPAVSTEADAVAV